MKWKQQIAGYFNFSRKERIAALVLALLFAVILFLPSLLPVSSTKSPAFSDTSWVAALKKLEQQAPAAKSYRDYPRPHELRYEKSVPGRRQSQPTLFYFDPNTIEPGQWKKLGLRDKTIQTIQRFLSKGGRFRKPEDLEKVYGLFPDEFERLSPYIRIVGNSPAPVSPALPSRYEGKKPAVLDINTADTTAFMALPGIGSKLAARILLFREKLGGFHSVEQLREVYGLKDSVFQQIRPWLERGIEPVRKININTASLEQLRKHPYLGFALAKQIISYREAHGQFANTEGLLKSAAVDKELYTKLLPYLEF